jgi:hypothetical protein
MSTNRFLKLENNDWVTVGAESDPWTSQEISSAFQRVEALASDPARGNKVTEAGLEEAAVALTAENLHVFPALRREKSGGAEFVDPSGKNWDVKSPVSPPPDQDWQFAPEHHLTKVRKDFSNGDSVLLNLSRLVPADRDKTLKLFSQQLTENERGSLLVLSA